jgi:hypothetical protein
MGIEMLKKCDELWAFGKTTSEGMAAEIELANDIGITVRYLEDPEEVQHGQD